MISPIFVALGCLVLTLLLTKVAHRSANEAHNDLQALSDEDLSPHAELEHGLKVGRDRIRLGDEASSIGLLTDEERKAFKRREASLTFLVVALALTLNLLFSVSSLDIIVVSSLLALSGTYIYHRLRVRGLRQEYEAELIFHLPLVMERIVMAVSAGHDILSALRTTLELQAEESECRRVKLDPVSRLLDVVFRLTEAGVPFDEALREVAKKVPCPPVRHSFMHLGRAYKEGGEVVMPLKELSDSTQLFYQETVDERIAKMPVKATMPLLCTFFGLIVCFVTIPVLQVVTVTLKARQSAGL